MTKKCFFLRHRRQHFNRLSVILQTTHQFVPVAPEQIIPMVCRDEYLGEMGLKRYAVLANRPPLMNGRGGFDFAALVVFLNLSFLILKFLEVNRINVHSAYATATIFEPMSSASDIDK